VPDAFDALILKQTFCPVDPPAAAREITLVQQSEGQPKRAPHGSLYIAAAGPFVMSARPKPCALSGAANQVRGGCQPFKIVQFER